MREYISSMNIYSILYIKKTSNIYYQIHAISNLLDFDKILEAQMIHIENI